MKRLSVLSTCFFSVLLFVLTIFCLYPQVSYADTPQDLKLEYDFSAQTLSVTITHPSFSPVFITLKLLRSRKILP